MASLKCWEVEGQEGAPGMPSVPLECPKIPGEGLTTVPVGCWGMRSWEGAHAVPKDGGAQGIRRLFHGVPGCIRASRRVARCPCLAGDLTAVPPRVPKRPVINTPVVSISVHAAGAGALRAPLPKPITLQFRLLETQERSKPICVFWNHSLL